MIISLLPSYLLIAFTQNFLTKKLSSIGSELRASSLARFRNSILSVVETILIIKALLELLADKLARYFDTIFYLLIITD